MLLGIIAGFLTGLLGWQINLISIHRGIDRGRFAGLTVGLGAVAGDSVWISAAFAGAQTLLASHEEYWNPLKWLGVFTITFAALRILFHNSRRQAEPADPSRWNPTKSILIGFLVVIGNPALLILWMGISSFIFSAHGTQTASRLLHLLFLSGFIFGGMAWYVILFTLIFPVVRKWTDQRFHHISKGFAVLLLLGAAILFYKLLTGAI